jgi:NADPH:quinone reductase-like Zn-dependent oxidoreductase
MRTVVLEGGFGLQNLRCREAAMPSIGEHDVLLKMRAASLNYRDYLTVVGSYNPRLRLPLVPVSDGVGEVVDAGSRVTRVRVGDRVVPAFRVNWVAGPFRPEVRLATLGGPLDGVMSEYIAIPAEAAVQVPSFLSDAEAATLPVAAVTAWNALRVEGGIGPETSVLVQGTGGVALFALQLAKIAGASAIVISSSDEKLQKAKTLGADHLINYRTHPDWERLVQELTADRGVDLVLELGGAETLDKSSRCAALGGQISLIGNLSGSTAQVSLTRILMKHLRLQGITVGDRLSFEAMNRAIDRHRVRPVVDRVFQFGVLRQALEYLAEGRHFGKVCINFGAAA